jgi:hypothetical protein
MECEMKVRKKSEKEMVMKRICGGCEKKMKVRER